MKEGAQDFRSGQKFDHTIFFGENVDRRIILENGCFAVRLEAVTNYE